NRRLVSVAAIAFLLREFYAWRRCESASRFRYVKGDAARQPGSAGSASLLRELPGRIDRHPKLEHGRTLSRQSRLDRGPQRIHAAHALAARPERSGERGKVGVRQVRFAPAPLEERLLE